MPLRQPEEVIKLEFDAGEDVRHEVLDPRLERLGIEIAFGHLQPDPGFLFQAPTGRLVFRQERAGQDDTNRDRAIMNLQVPAGWIRR